MAKRPTSQPRAAAAAAPPVGPADTDGDVPISASPGTTPMLRPRAANGRFVQVVRDETVADSDLPADRFLDRELSWLQFNERVLRLASDEQVPLLERVRYLSIFTSNLDEFFMVRVAGLKRRVATGIAVPSPSGLEPREVLEQIAGIAHDLTLKQARTFEDSVRPALVEEGITIVHWDEVDEPEKARLGELFSDDIYPVLTPLAVDPAHPFPYISGLSLNLAVILINPRSGKEHFARIKMPPSLPRFLKVRRKQASVTSDLFEARFVPLEEVIAAHLDQLFPGMEVHEHYAFRVTRNEDLEVEEDDAENLLTALEKELTRRRFGPPVRLEVAEDMDDHVMDLLTRELGVTDEEVYRLPVPLDLRGLDEIADIDRTDLHFPPFVARTSADLAPTESAKPADLIKQIGRQDVLLQHPYESFSTSVQAFLEQAAADPQVLAIKQTLYRTSGDSPIVDALIDAASAGKQVLAVVEIKARFDEQNNIEWARKLEHAGVHVVYGIVGLKTHCKAALVVRQEGDGLRRYCHVGTGNYNPKTARLYEDIGILTADPVVGQDLTRLFNQLSGVAPRSKFKRLLVAPRTVRDGLLARIERQVERQAKHGDGYVGLKVNSIVDEQLIDALYRASIAGVRVDVWVRGICALRPGVEGLSENIRVHSVLGRFLEHSRVYLFGSGAHREAWIGSADLMHRNLDRRVEALVRIVEERHVDQLYDLVARGMSPDYAHFSLGSSGRWSRVHRAPDGAALPDIQEALIAQHGKRHLRARR